MTMNDVTFQAKTGARVSAKMNSNEPVIPYKIAQAYVRKRDVFDIMSLIL
jgi:hypothetical protein